MMARAMAQFQSEPCRLEPIKAVVKIGRSCLECTIEWALDLNQSGSGQGTDRGMRHVAASGREENPWSGLGLGLGLGLDLGLDLGLGLGLGSCRSLGASLGQWLEPPEAGATSGSLVLPCAIHFRSLTRPD